MLINFEESDNFNSSVFLIQKKSTSTKKGFTLIELLVVISIISLLTSIVSASLVNAKNKATVTKITGEVKQFQLAMETYRTYNGSYYNTASAVPANNVAAMSLFVNAMNPYIKINDLSFTKDSSVNNFHLNFIRSNGSNCGGVIPSTNGYDVIFYLPSNIPNIPFLKRWSTVSSYYCFINE